MPSQKHASKADQILEKVYQDFEQEYLFQVDWAENNSLEALQSFQTEDSPKGSTPNRTPSLRSARLSEVRCVKKVLSTSCACGQACEKHFHLEETIHARETFNALSWREKGCFLLPLLDSFRVSSSEATSGRTRKERSRQKYIYKINSDRYVCSEAFRFYHGISLRKLKYFQRHLNEVGVLPPDHGNARKRSNNAHSEEVRKAIKAFLTNFASAHGLPDPGRDLRTGSEKLKILLPSAMTYTYVHQVYSKSLGKGETSVGYQSFKTIWRDVAPHVVFQKPRTDLCKTCEDHIKNIRMASGRKNEEEKIAYYEEALDHLTKAKRERDHYRDTVKQAQTTCGQLVDGGIPPKKKAKGRPKFAMHYSWDFAQQLLYPYEDQQVGPI